MEKSRLKKFILKSSVFRKISLEIIKNRFKKKHNITFEKSTVLGFSCVFEGGNYFGNNTLVTGSNFGYGTYVSDNSGIKKAFVGRYTSIGPEVKIIFGRHPSHTYVSTHPAFFSTRKQAGFSFTEKQLFKEFPDTKDSKGKYTTVIGSDVWIGARVSIMDGVKIGDGAIVAAGAVVVKDVAPFSIVGGVPAKHIKYRFNQDQIDFLVNLKWWEKDLNWIKKHSRYFSDIEYLIKICSNG
jgi:acetyltransferase-like isoleucine patch superfamily enzyme